MSFVNTVDIIGDEVLAAKIIDRSITEISDNISKSIGHSVFQTCTGLVAANFPAVMDIGYGAFQGCSELVTADFSAARSIDTYAFSASKKLTALILRSETVCTLRHTNALTSTPISSGAGYIYVPSALVDTYKAATNWSNYAARFRAIEDYPEICGG